MQGFRYHYDERATLIAKVDQRFLKNNGEGRMVINRQSNWRLSEIIRRVALPDR
jgi:hypothetical protein